MDEKLDGYISIKDAKKNVFDNYEEGIECPVCGQYVRRYKRKITSSMAYALILIYWYFKSNPDETWLHVENHFKKLAISPAIRGDFPKMRFWKLIERKEGEKEDSNPNAGYYTITERGKQFAENKIKVPKHAYIFNDNVEEFSDIDISIEDALGNNFDYGEMMSSGHEI